ncbi:MAG: hypothetical protein AB7N76_00180 [Planctomycetota bacterium]
MSHSHTETGGKRVMTRDLYGLHGYHERGECYDHLVAGLEVELTTDERGRPVLLARGRRYPLSFAAHHDVLERSKPKA